MIAKAKLNASCVNHSGQEKPILAPPQNVRIFYTNLVHNFHGKFSILFMYNILSYFRLVSLNLAIYVARKIVGSFSVDKTGV